MIYILLTTRIERIETFLAVAGKKYKTKHNVPYIGI